MPPEYSFHRSRWKYWWQYIIFFILVILAIWFTDNGVDIPSWIFAGLALVLLAMLEILIRMEQVTLTEREIEYRVGIFSKDITRVVYGSVSNVSLKQTLLQRLLRYGDVYIDTPGGTQYEIRLKKFDDAARIEKIISGHVHRHHQAKTQHQHLPSGSTVK